MSAKKPFLLLMAGCLSVAAMARQAYTTTGDVIKAYPTPATCPTGLTWDGKLLWLADLKTDSLYAIDPSDGRITLGMPAPTFKPLGLAFDGEQLWCVCGEENRLYRLRPQDGLVTRTFESPVPLSTGLAWDGKYLWVASRSAKQIHQISPEDGTTILSFPSPSGYPQGLAFDGRYLWVADRIKNRIYMISPIKGEVILMFDAPAPYADGLAWDGKNLWNVDFQSDSLYCISIGDGDLCRRKDEKNQQVEFSHELRNYGPGTVEDLDVYIALPQNLPGQQILGKPEFSSPPKDFVTDQWGQKVAHFRSGELAAGSIQRVSMTVRARMWNTSYYIFPEKVGSLDDIPGDIGKKYLADDEKFNLKHPSIQKAIAEAVGDEKNPFWIMRKVFNYVIEHMEYELSGGWNTAPAVLERGNGSCSEYTFVFIALCRAAGLPARYAGSIAIRGDDASLDDVFHRWAEVYLPNYGWIPVDPSRGDSESPEEQAASIGNVFNTCLITTLGGGNSQYLTWTYNSDEKWTSQGKCKIYTEHIGEWRPLSIAEMQEVQEGASSRGGSCEP